MALIAYGLIGFLMLTLLAQLASIVLAHIKQSTAPNAGILGSPMVSVLRPLCGLENNLDETLASTFLADYPDFEIILCVANPNDPAIALANRLICAHPKVRARLLIGEDRVSSNPKLNNLVKGWYAAQADWILMADSNVLLPPDYIKRLLAEWRADTGLVSSPPAGLRPDGFAARLECAFLNSFQGRWQLASAMLGNGFAQGKMLFWHRAVLERAGGIAMLGAEMAEDVASTKLVRAQGLKVRLTQRLFAQPVGRRSFGAVWRRQVRWSKVRRLGFLPLFLPEIFIGGALPLLAGAGLVASGVISAAEFGAFGVVWYGAEFLLARASGWPAQAVDVLAWLCRDALLPLLWLAAWFGNGFDWRGNAMSAAEVSPDHPQTGAPVFAKP
jgi:ceramide glucosyltransferase